LQKQKHWLLQKVEIIFFITQPEQNASTAVQDSIKTSVIDDNDIFHNSDQHEVEQVHMAL
jgi:hypothetical protein